MKKLLWMIVGCLIFVGNAAMAAGAIKFDFQADPVIEMWTYEMGEDDDPVKVTSPLTFSQQMSQNGCFWANNSPALPPALPAEDFMYSVARMTYTTGGISLTTKGLAQNVWGNEAYATSGTAVSSLESRNLYDGSFLPPNACYIYGAGTVPENRALVFYMPSDDDLMWSGSNRAFINSFFFPEITFDQGVTIQSVDLANTVFAAREMKLADSGFSKGPFSYIDNSYFGVTITGIDSEGRDGESLTFLLADFLTYDGASEARDNTLHELTYLSAVGQPMQDATTVMYLSLANGILDDWARDVSLLSLGEVFGLKFSMFTSDYGLYGFNTPLYFAMDNIVLAGGSDDDGGGSGVPEPATWLMLLTGGAWLMLRRSR